MKKLGLILLLVISVILSGCTQGTQQAKQKPLPTFEGQTLNVVATSEKYKVLFDKFTEETKANVEFLSMSSGEVIAKIKAEGGKPMADIWFGGGIDAFMAAKNDGLLEMYKPKVLKR